LVAGAAMAVLNRIDRHQSSLGMAGAATFWRHPYFRDMGLLKARFTRHRYELHTHPTYVIALITQGCERLRIGRRRLVAPINTVIVVNPEECHDGERQTEIGWSYRTFYPSVDLMTDVARELDHHAIPLFTPATIDDPVLAHMLAVAHRTAERDTGAAAEAAMLEALRHLLLGYSDRHRQVQPRERSGAAQRFAVYREVIDAEIAHDLNLQHLATAARVTRFQVIRDFKSMTGLTPGAYIRNQRFRLACRLIEQGSPLAEAAAEAGFADQSHLSRVFRRSQGITPGMFRHACVQDGARLSVS
jgi:AraC-like DNA-binding protein